ncbi:MAG: DMT family transporter [Gammaproteobacteria bacterium]
MLAFAANSVLCRMALGVEAIDAISFTSIRLLSGATTLLVIVLASAKKDRLRSGGSWMSSAMLFLYALPFSLAYISLDAGTGALILFAAVQITMVGTALLFGDRPHPMEWIGLTLALLGLIYLLLPGLSAPPLGAAAMMFLAGVCWGIYSLRGRKASNPLVDTASNFLRCVPAALAVSLLFADEIWLSSKGVVLAITSGALASGLGYVIWYSALRGMSATRAATVQLSVPVIAALGGILFLAESLTIRLTLSSALILGGIGLAIFGSRNVARAGVS